jgi:hypothetical protein
VRHWEELDGARVGFSDFLNLFFFFWIFKSFYVFIGIFWDFLPFFRIY